MLNAGIVDIVLSSDVDGEFEIELEQEDDGGLVYQIEGVDEQRLLGLFSVLIPRTVTVSAETGQIVDTNQDILSIILDFLSI